MDSLLHSKKLSVFTDSFVPDFIRDQYPAFVEFLRALLKYMERNNDQIRYQILDIFPGDHDPEQDGTLFDGIYIRVSSPDETILKSIIGEKIISSTSGSVLQVDNVVYDTNLSEWLIKATYLTNKPLLNFEYIAHVDFGEYTRIANMILYRDIDHTLEYFIEFHKNEYLSNLPELLSTDIRTLIKNIKSYYLNRGTEKSYEFLFRAIWDSQVEFYYPKIDVLRVSDGKWFEPKVIEPYVKSDIYKFTDGVVIGQTSGGRADVEKIVVDFNQKLSAVELSQSDSPVSMPTIDDGVYYAFNVVRASTAIAERVDTNSQLITVIDWAKFDTHYTANKTNVPNIYDDTNELNNYLIFSSYPAYIQITDNLGTFLPGETIELEGDNSVTTIINSIDKFGGRWLNNDGKLSSDKYLQDNYFYQDFSYVLKTDININEFRPIIENTVHPAGYLMFGEFIQGTATLLCWEMSYATQYRINYLTDDGVIEYNQEFIHDFNVKTFTDEVLNPLITTYNNFQANIEDYPYNYSFDDMEQLDNMIIGDFEEGADELMYYIPSSKITITDLSIIIDSTNMDLYFNNQTVTRNSIATFEKHYYVDGISSINIIRNSIATY